MELRKEEPRMRQKDIRKRVNPLKTHIYSIKAVKLVIAKNQVINREHYFGN